MATSHPETSASFNELLNMVKKDDAEEVSLFFEKLPWDSRLPLFGFQDSEGKSILHHMVTHQNVNLLRIALAFIPEDELYDCLALQDSPKYDGVGTYGGDTPLHHAVMKSDYEMVKCILNSLPDDDDRYLLMDVQNDCVDVDEIPPSSFGEQTVLHLAHRNSKLMGILLFSVESSSDRLHLLMTSDTEGNAPVHICFTDVLKVALESLNQEDQATLCKMKDSAGMSKLFIMVRHDDIAAVKTMFSICEPSCRYQLCCDADNRGKQAVHFIRSSEMISLFVESLPYRDFLLLVQAQDVVGNTKLHSIADTFMFYDFALLGDMLRAIEPEDRLKVLCMRNKDGFTVCHSAVMSGSTEVIEHILNSITDHELEPLLTSVVRSTEAGGKKVREDMARSSNTPIAQQYLAANAALSQRQPKSLTAVDSDWGDSCLHYAAIKNDQCMVRCILDACPPSLGDQLRCMKDIDGFTANEWISEMRCSA